MQRDSYNASIVLSNYLKWRIVLMLYCKIMCSESRIVTCLICKFASDLKNTVSHEFIHYVSHDLIHYVSHDLIHYVSQLMHYVSHDLIHYVSHDLIHYVSHDVTIVFIHRGTLEY